MPVDVKNLSVENLSFKQLSIIFKDNILILIIFASLVINKLYKNKQ